MRLFGRRLGWGMKLWFALGLLMFPLMAIGELISLPWLFFPYGALLVLVVMPTLNIVDWLNRRRGGKGIMWEDG